MNIQIEGFKPVNEFLSTLVRRIFSSAITTRIIFPRIIEVPRR